MNINSDNLQKLRQLIYDTLDPLIDSDYCLLDIPDYANIGDQLIYEGQLSYLKRLQHKMIYTSNDKYEDFNKIPGNAIILLQGGGNFGDLWKTHQEFRLKVIETCPKNKIIIFPQTVYYKNTDRLLRDAEIFNKHSNLTICARDNESYALLKKYFHNNQIVMLPDMALCLDLSKHTNQADTNKALIMVRKDLEVNKNFDLNKVKSLLTGNRKVEIKDWPTLEIRQLKFRLVSIINFLNSNISKFFLKIGVLRPLLDSRYGLLRGNLGRWYVEQGIKFINNYDEIYTTRLHGFILSILLNKKVHIIDNSYGKNSNFYNTWMTGFNNSNYIKL
jgi:exopolysaccharide biosynthesis predicted pyruvyltransferase EpsI